MTLALSAGLFVFLAAVDADAAPIRPDIRKLATETQTATPRLGPARAGWDGPEVAHRRGPADPALDPSVTLRANKAALITAAIPDPRAVGAVILVIFLMRLLRNMLEQEKRRQPALATIDETERLAA